MQNWSYWKHNLLEAPSLHLAKAGAMIHVLVYKTFLRNKYPNLSNNRVWYFQPEAFNRETFLEKLKPKQSTFQSLLCGRNKAHFEKARGAQACMALSDSVPARKMPSSSLSHQPWIQQYQRCCAPWQPSSHSPPYKGSTFSQPCLDQ